MCQSKLKHKCLPLDTLYIKNFLLLISRKKKKSRVILVGNLNLLSYPMRCVSGDFNFKYDSVIFDESLFRICHFSPLHEMAESPIVFFGVKEMADFTPENEIEKHISHVKSSSVQFDI